MAWGQRCLDGRRDLLSPRSRLRGELLGVPAGLLVDEPGIARPNEHVEEAEHLVGEGENERHMRHLVVIPRKVSLFLSRPKNVKLSAQNLMTKR